MPLVTASGVSRRFGAQTVLDGVSFALERNDRVALVGVNGTGKSTLLRILAGLEEPDAGSVSRSRNARIAYLPQDPDFDSDETLHDAMLGAFREAIAAQERLHALERHMAESGGDPASLEEYGRLQLLVEHAGYDYRRQIERVLLGLDLDRSLWDAPVRTLSGGQRTRANLARTLLRDADVLLLDEPTNHLDIPAVEWLESYLRDLKRAFLIVAHDRYLLDHVTRRTLELSRGRITEYDAPYSRYLELRAERMERLQDTYDAQQRHIAKTEEFVRRYGAGQRSKEARGRQKRLDRLERVDRPDETASVDVRLARAVRTGEIVMETRHLVAGFPGNPLVRLPEHVVVRRGDRIAVIGANGSGKTTLLRTLVDSLPALAGEKRWGSRVSIGYYSQSLSGLDDARTVLEEIQRARALSEEEARTYLGRFLFSGDDAYKTVGVLSGGERSRVALATLILEEPNVLVLDEPTNHLDIASRDALQDVLEQFQGTLLFVSHDRFLIDSLAGQLWLIRDGRLTRYDGTYSMYAGGSAKPLDWLERQSIDTAGAAASPETRVRELADEVDALAARLAEAGPSTPLAHLSDMTDRYDKARSSLEEAQAAWIRAVRTKLRSFSA